MARSSKRRILRLCATSVVIIDHAPAALFAAKCLGIKTMELAAGFYIPPAQTPYPVFRPWENVSQADLLVREGACLAAMNSFAVMNGVKPFIALAQALASDVPLLTSFAELDHYPRRADARYIGPTNSFTSGEVVNWSGEGKHRIFVYLRELPAIEKVVGQFGVFDAEVIAYCPDLGPNQCKALRSNKMKLVDRPVQIDSLLKDCNLIVTNGGHGLMTACILFAVPALVIPLYLEQRLMADCVTRAQIGLGLMPPDVPLKLESFVQRILHEQKFKEAILKLQQKYRPYDLSKTTNRLVNTLERMALTR